eukprot:6458908-Pyramimonas_sp.AAC.1
MRDGDDTRTIGPPVGPCWSSVISRFRPRSTCLGQRDHRQHDALPTSCRIAARFGRSRTDHGHESPPA